MAKDLAELTEPDFQAYERVRVRGKYNMFDPRAKSASGLDEETFLGVVTHYKGLMERFPNVRKS